MAKINFTAPKGMRDIMGSTITGFRRVEEAFRDVCALYCFEELRTPHLEATNLFCRSVGETSDIVEKEMYALTTAGGDELALRPENTAGVVRAYLEHGFHKSSPYKRLFYYGEMFRHESAQKKRYRSFTQAGVECFGSSEAWTDAQVIALARDLFLKLGLGDVRIVISTFGDKEDRVAFRAALAEYFEGHRETLCPDCTRRLQTNVFRLLDCKEEKCRALANDAPSIYGYLGEGAKTHYAELKEALEKLGVNYTENPHLVRGLDYYNRTIFEIFPAGEEGRQDALGAGGRYDGLAEQLGGPKVPAIGFALGVDRIALQLAEQDDKRVEKLGAYVVAVSPEARTEAETAVGTLRKSGIVADITPKHKGVGAQLKTANKSGLKFAIFVGGDEPYELKNMETGEQLGFADLASLIEKIN